MESLKQEVTNALNQLPNTAEIEDMIAVLNQIKLEKETLNRHETIEPEMKPVSCYDLAKDYIGCIEGPEDLSTNQDYLKGYGL